MKKRSLLCMLTCLISLNGCISHYEDLNGMGDWNADKGAYSHSDYPYDDRTITYQEPKYEGFYFW